MKRVILFLWFVFEVSSMFAQQRPDTAFRLEGVKPIFTKKKPRVLIDGAHYNFHQLTTGYAPLGQLLRQFGFEVDAINQSIKATTDLEKCDILVMSNAIHPNNRGRWYNPILSAYSEKEIQIISQWVKDGGSLLLIADHMPFAGASQPLAQAFGVEFVNGFTGVSGTQWPPNVFGLSGIGNNPIYRSYFPVDSVSSFTGSAIRFPKKYYSLLDFTPRDTALITDTAWVFNQYTKRLPLAGFSQGGLMPFGEGRLAVFGEAAMFTAQIANNLKVGFNSPEAKGNAHFIINLFLSLVNESEFF